MISNLNQTYTLSLKIQISKLKTTIFNFCKPKTNENCILNVFFHVFLRFEGLEFKWNAIWSELELNLTRKNV